MQRLSSVLWMAFLGSVAFGLMQRGVYFYAHNELHFAESLRLTMALISGAAYVVGAMLSHRLCLKIKEKPALLLTILIQVASILAIFCWPTIQTLLIAGFTIMMFFNGMMWPVLESYASAGKSARQQAHAIGRYNLAWSSAVAVGVATAGPILAYWAPGMFITAGLLALSMIWFSRPLETQPLHLPHDHPDRIQPEQMVRARKLLISSRWMLLTTYLLLMIVVPLIPDIFHRLEFSTSTAPAMTSIIDACRFLAFVFMHLTPRWHNRVDVLVVTALVMPVSFAMIFVDQSLPVVITGEILFGLSEGAAYYAALYYAMWVKNASVDAGGVHESLIGAGFTLGPLLGLLCVKINPMMTGYLPGLPGYYLPGMLLSVGPILLVVTLGSLWPLIQLRRNRAVLPERSVM